jgi:hypothetical protein
MKTSAQVVAGHSHLESDIASLISKPFRPCRLGLLLAELQCDSALRDALPERLTSLGGSICRRACRVFEGHGSRRGGRRRDCTGSKHSC